MKLASSKFQAWLRYVLFGAFEVIDGLGRCWFLLFATLLVAFLMAFVPQGREALWAAGASGQVWHVRAFFATSLAGSVLVMLFASAILEAGRKTESPVSHLQDFVRFTVPGLIGLLAAFLVPLLIERQVGGNAWLLPQRRAELHELGVLFQRLAVPAIVLARCPKTVYLLLLPWQADRRQAGGLFALIMFGMLGLTLSAFPFSAGVLMLATGLIIVDIFWWRTGQEAEMRLWRRHAASLLAAGWIIAGLWLGYRPESRAATLGPATLILFAEAFWLAVVFALYSVIGRWLTQGVSVVLVLIVALSFLSGPFNLRAVRTLKGDHASKKIAPVSLSKYIDAWLEARREKIEISSVPYPVFVASAEGGGIRAACWTAGVLGALQDAEPAFSDHLLGISGVSGGSLGAATFVALVHMSQANGNDSITLDSEREAGPFQTHADRILGRDFLSPVLATMLIPDVAACLFHFEGAKDRASVLEQSFEIGWRNAMNSNTFEGPMHAIWSGESNLKVPALFFNSTEADTGVRIVNSHVTLDPDLSPAISLTRMVPPESLRLSTAVLLSARFPVISPIGVIRNTVTNDDLHIVDGGYADNSGTVTAAEIVTALNASAARLGLHDKVRAVGIVITDNPIVIGEEAADADRQHRENLESTAAGAVLAPFETMDRIRQSLSKKHREAFTESVISSGGEVLDGFALQASRIEFPLGWMLSNGTRMALSDQIQSLSKDPSGHFQSVRQMIRMTRKPVSTDSK